MGIRSELEGKGQKLMRCETELNRPGMKRQGTEGRDRRGCGDDITGVVADLRFWGYEVD